MARSDSTPAHDSNTLFLSSSLDDDFAKRCLDHLPTGSLEGAHLAFVAHTHAADDVVESWFQYAGVRPERLDVIDVGGMLRSATSASSSMTLRPGVTVHTQAAEDLTGLGITLSELLTADGDIRTVVCFDSLTMLLQYIDVETAYQFLHIVTGRIHAVGATGLFHMDPTAHDDQTVAVMTSLFDVVVDLD